MGGKGININYYPECPEPELATGVGCDSDISTITLLWYNIYRKTEKTLVFKK